MARDKQTVVESPREIPETPERNPDPNTGAPGAHPVGVGVGAAGAAAAGAVIGAAAGPVGAAVGTVVGALAGGLVGKGIAEGVNPTVEDTYWRKNYETRPYFQSGRTYEEFRPAYQYGWESYGRWGNRNFEDSEADLRAAWEANPDLDGLTWDEARLAARDAWRRIEERRADEQRRKDTETGR
jgi:hypothetical protein